MIRNELAAKFYLPPIEEYPFPEQDWYKTFLSQSDYVIIKIAEATFLGKEIDEDYSEVIEARKYARQRLNELQGE